MVEEKIVRLLDFSRFQVREYLEVGNCVRNGYYDGQDGACRRCESGMECEWLNRNDDIVALKQQRLEELDAALDIGVCYVESRAALWGHDVRTCHCDSCQWLREAKETRREIRGVLGALSWVGLKTARRTDAGGPPERRSTHQ